MKSPYETLNWFYLHGIPFLPLTKRYNAVNCRIGYGKQKVFIPKCYFDITNEEIKLKDNVDLEWFWNKKTTQNNVKKYLEDLKTFEIKVCDEE